MDWASWVPAAALPLTAIGTLAPVLRERAALSRLERIDRLLRDTDLDEHHASLLRRVREVLVRRVSAVELAPGFTPLGKALVWFMGVFALGLIALGIGQLAAGNDSGKSTFVGAAISIAGVVVIASAQPLSRRRFEKALLPPRD